MSGLGDAPLPRELVELVRQCADASRLPGPERDRVTRELTAHLRDALDAGHSLADIVRDFGAPERTGMLIRTTWPRRSSPRRAVVPTLASLGIATLATIYGWRAVSLHMGAPLVAVTAADHDAIRDIARRPVDLDGTSRLLSALVTRMYTDDGSGDGHLTSQGLRIVQRLKDVDRPSTTALLAEPAYFAFAASRRDVEREARRVIELAARAKAEGPASPAWRDLDREAARFDWAARDAYRFAPIAIVLPRLVVALRREAAPRIASAMDAPDP